MVWPVQTHPAQSTGPESKRNSGDGGYFSLDFSFYRTALPVTTPAQADSYSIRDPWRIRNTFARSGAAPSLSFSRAKSH